MIRRGLAAMAVVGAALSAALAPGPARAVIVGGAATFVDGVAQAAPPDGFVKLAVPFDASDPDNTVGDNTFEAPFLYGFDENQNVIAPADIAVDIGAPVPAGRVVASHYVFIDPAQVTRLTGYVDFDAPIFGIATSRDRLIATDFLQNNAVTYLSPSARGLETAAQQGGTIDDSVRIDPDDPFRLLVDLQARDPGDYVRVFTRFSPTAPVQVPLPGAAWGLLTAAAALGLRARRRG
ncbi:MAG: hypothetical protein AAFU61_05650 [Pseudomonadota bacterium]